MTLLDIRLHIVWTTKYRKPVLCGKEAIRLRALVREICAELNVTIIGGKIKKDRVHLFVSVLPEMSVSSLLQKIKGKTANILLRESDNLRKIFWGGHLWARGYFVTSDGSMLRKAIEE